MKKCPEKLHNEDTETRAVHLVSREACHKKTGPPIFGSPGPNISKYLDPRIAYFNFAEIFEPPRTKISEYLKYLSPIIYQHIAWG